MRTRRNEACWWACLCGSRRLVRRLARFVLAGWQAMLYEMDHDASGTVGPDEFIKFFEKATTIRFSLTLKSLLPGPAFSLHTLQIFFPT